MIDPTSTTTMLLLNISFQIDDLPDKRSAKLRALHVALPDSIREIVSVKKKLLLQLEVIRLRPFVSCMRK